MQLLFVPIVLAVVAGGSVPTALAAVVPRAACVAAGPTAVWGGAPEDAQLDNFPWAELRVIEPGTAANPNPTD